MWHKKLFNLRFYRRIFNVFNAIFWACGWGALTIGIWLYTQKNLYSHLAPPSYSAMSAAGLCTTIGAMILIISFIGCAGNWLNSKCLLMSYFSFVLLLFLIQLMTGCMGYLYQETVRERAKISLRHTINATREDNSRAFVLWNTWNQMQTELKCCGVNGPEDWFYYPRWKGRKFVPDSCCDQANFNMSIANAMQNCGRDVANHAILYKQGCATPFTDWLLQHLHIIGMVALIFGIVEIFVLTASLRLFTHLYQKERDLNRSKIKYRFCRDGNINDGEASLVAVEDSPNDE